MRRGGIITLLFPAPDRIDRLLLALLRTDVPAGAGEGTDPLDWEEIFRRAMRHQVLPPVLDALAFSTRGFGLPEDLEARAQELRRASVLRLAIQEAELIRAARAVASVGVRPVVLKGSALNELAYGGAGRSFADIDLLVPAPAYAEAFRAITAAGFRLRSPDQSQRYHRPHHYHDILIGRGGCVLELHWGLSRPGDLFHLDAGGFLEHAVPAGGDSTLLWTSPTDLLLHTAAQALGEGYDRLLRVCDADRLLRRCRERIDERRLVVEARRGGLGASLWLLLILARDLLDSPVGTLPAALRPPTAVRLGVASLTPAELLVTEHVRRHTGLRHLYLFWLSEGASRRFRALVRVVRLQATQLALRDARESPTRRLLATGERILSFVKLSAFQAVRLAALPLRRGGASSPAHLLPPGRS